VAAQAIKRRDSMALLLVGVAAVSHTCHAPVELDESYAPDHLNFLCMNYTRPVPLPCRKAHEAWKPRWFNGSRPRFIIYSWWPPGPDEGPCRNCSIDAYAEAGFNLVLSAAYGRLACPSDSNASTTHDMIFDALIQGAEEFSERGVMSIFDMENECKDSLVTQAFGNKTGGIVEIHSNITARAASGHLYNGSDPVASRVWSKGRTVPELEYITAELKRRGVAELFAGIQMHDDTLTQTGETIAGAEWLRAHSPELVPIVNQVSGNSGPQTLYRSGLFISAPEQYPIRCIDGNCTTIKGGKTPAEGALDQMKGYARRSSAQCPRTALA
jgi:hypothetical protein